jgi:hypothetical protein
MAYQNFENVVVIKKLSSMILIFNINFSRERALEELLQLLRIWV